MHLAMSRLLISGLSRGVSKPADLTPDHSRDRVKFFKLLL